MFYLAPHPKLERPRHGSPLMFTIPWVEKYLSRVRPWHVVTIWGPFTLYMLYRASARQGALAIAGWMALGVFSWTLLEYLLHRFVLHRLPIVLDMHAAHHASPRALVGTPTWLSIAILWVVIFLPMWSRYSFNLASGVITGVMTGFLWYGIVHHAIHHRRPRFLASRLTASIHRHLVHHYSERPHNFGVTTPLWDYLFGTAAPRH